MQKKNKIINDDYDTYLGHHYVFNIIFDIVYSYSGMIVGKKKYIGIK